MQGLRVGLAASVAAVALTAVIGVAASGQDIPDSEGREVIVVTGEKVDRSIQDTPTSVAVVTPYAIETENLVDLYDIVNRTANLTSTFAGTGFTIRGISNTNVSGTGFGDLATVYLDGSPLWRDALAGGPLDLWDLAQAEIFRGPQSTLQGRNALAGAIILSTQDPTFQREARGRAMATDEDGERRFALAFGGPIIADQVAFRIAAETAEADGLIDNPTLGINADARSSDMIRGKLLIEPSALPDLRVLLSYLHDENQKGQDYSYVDEPDYWENRLTLGNRANVDTVETDIAGLKIDYDWSELVTLSSVTTLSNTKRARVYDGDESELDLAYGDYGGEQEALSQEFRAVFDGEHVSGVLGAYYSKFENPDDYAHSVFSLNLDQDLGLTQQLIAFGLDPTTAGLVVSLYPERLYIDTSQHYPAEINTSALFGDAVIDLNERVRLHAGFRFDHEEQTVSNENTVTLVDPLPDPMDYAMYGPDLVFVVQTVNDLVNGQIAAANSSSPETDQSYDAFLPKLGVSIDVAEDKTLSVTVQRGYRSGGGGINPAQAQVYSFDPEYTWNYDVAFRSLWLDGMLTLNANAFYIDWTDQQVLVYLSENIYDYETQNAGSSRVYGFEVESAFDASDALNLYASLGYANTKFNEFEVIGAQVDDLSGREFASAPRWTAAIGANFNPFGNWMGNVNANYRSAAYSQVTQQDERDVPDRVLLNARFGWQNERVGAFVTATNILDEKYWDYSYTMDGHEFALLGEPRMFGIVLEGWF